jgi:hypothetical protein
MLQLETGKECPSDLAPPVVIETIMLVPPHYGAYYRGEPWVFVSAALDDYEFLKTVIHETVHYASYNSKVDYTRCGDEQLAREITAQLLEEEYSDDWKVWYGCTEKEVVQK